MNVKELIGKYEYLNHNFFRRVDTSEILKDLRQLDEHQKVKIPQFVADLIEYAKRSDWDLEDTFQDIAGNDGSSDIYQWYYSDSNNMDTFARAWLDGYEVEKEKRYRVVMPNVSSSGGVLTRIKHDDSWIWIDTLGTIVEGRTHTRKELEEAGFGWVFDCEGIEIEEVE